jgi:hypothetical protein
MVSLDINNEATAQHKAIMKSDFIFPAFESHGGRLETFDDGHVPETFRRAQSSTSKGADESTTTSSSCAETPPRIVRYKRKSKSDSVENVHIYDKVLNPHHVQMFYEATATKQDSSDVDSTTSETPCLNLVGESPWGTYVTVEEALEWINWTNMNGRHNIIDKTTYTYEEYLATWRETLMEFYKWQEQHKSTSLSDEKKEEQSCQMNGRVENLDLAKNLGDMDTIRHALAVEAVANFFVETIPSSSSSPGHYFVAASQQNQSTNEELYTKSDFLNRAHGVAVWALSSRPGASVQYHIDYAELLRYEYNVTVPPLWAGTIQCSALCNNTQSTYDTESTNSTKRMVGGEFCVNLLGLEHYAAHGYKGMISGDPMGGWKSPDTTTSGVYVDSSNKWVTIPYAFNRGIVHNGDLPHLSAPIEIIDDDHLSRVIVGFNVFGHDVGARVAKAPEHSRQFRRQVKLYRTTLSAPIKADGYGSYGGMNLSQIRKNKGLTKLLVLAKRERVKEQLRRDQKQLTSNIWNHLLRHHGSGRFLCVGDIIEEFGIPNPESGWPTPVDAHVHLHNMLKRHDSTDDGGKYHDVGGVAGICGAYYKMRLVDDLESSTQGDLISTSTAILITRCENDTG